MRHASVPIVALVGFVACHASPVTRTSDEGWTRASWEVLPSPTRASLRGLSVVDASTAWVSGANGTVLRTTDGGSTWADVAPADTRAFDFRDIAAFDAHCAVAVVAGQPAHVYRTIDGGRSWRLVLVDARREAFFDAVAFAGTQGVLVGDPIDGGFSVWTTLDAGLTWQPVAHERVIARPGEAAFAASGTCAAMRVTAAGPVPCFVTGGAATRFLADDGDGAWRSGALPLRCGDASAGAFAIAFRGGAVDPAVGIAVGGDYEAPHAGAGSAAWTADGGRTWRPARVDGCGYRSAVAWLDDRAAIAVGSHGASLTRDAGRTWHAFGDLGFHAVDVGRDGAVYACGADGRIARLRRP